MSFPKTNRFLDSLSVESRDLLMKQCVEIDLPLRKSLYEAENVPRYAYFLTSGIASVVAAMDDGSTAEVGLTVIAGVLQRSGLIEYKRGRVTILDRENLEAAACDCYKITKALYIGLYTRALPGAAEVP